MMDLSRRLFAEWFGTMMLVATVVGSGIMAERLAGGNVALALLGKVGYLLLLLLLICSESAGQAGGQTGAPTTRLESAHL